MSASCSAADGEMNARRWWQAQCVDKHTYMAGRRICAVCRLLRCRWLPMGGELAVAALVLGEHGEVRGRAKQRVVVVDGCLIKCHPKTWRCHAVMNRCNRRGQALAVESENRWWCWWCGRSSLERVRCHKYWRAARTAAGQRDGQCKTGGNCRAKAHEQPRQRQGRRRARVD
jgi:hypothetical protein